jgi:transcriptional regulator with XRE-family HTH domain
VSGSVGSEIRAARRAAGMSLRALAHRLGASAATVSALENDKTRVTVDRLNAVAKILNVPVRVLLALSIMSPAELGHPLLIRHQNPAATTTIGGNFLRCSSTGFSPRRSTHSLKSVITEQLCAHWRRDQD